MHTITKRPRQFTPPWQRTQPADITADSAQCAEEGAQAQHDTERDAAAAHVRHAKQLQEIDRYGESLRRMRKAIDAAHGEGRDIGHRAGWWGGWRWGSCAGIFVGMALALGAVRLMPRLFVLMGWLP